MKLTRLIKQSRLFWPREISILDGKLLGEGRGVFATLFATYERVELRQSRVNEWHEIMSYAIYCGFHKQAMEKMASGSASVVRFDDIDFEYVALKVSAHLSQVYPSWPRWIKRQFVCDLNR